MVHVKGEICRKNMVERGENCMNISKADVLIVIMGTNPFPNIISSLTRVKENGLICCICTKETTRGEKPFERFKSLLARNNKFINIDILELPDYLDRKDIEDKTSNKLNEIFRKISGDLLLEINYTGGKKIISSVVYEVIKNFDYKDTGRKIDVNLTYIDSERELMYIESGGSYKPKYSSDKIKLTELKESFKIGIVDIIQTYNSTFNENKFKEKPDKEELSNALGRLFENVSFEDFNKMMDFKTKLYETADAAQKGEKRKTFLNDIDILLKSFNIPLSIEDIKSAGFQKDKEIVEYFRKTDWFEEFVLYKLLPLKEEHIIEEIVANADKKGSEDENNYEVDIVIYKKYKLYAISITTISDRKEAEGKLYEIHQRANDLGGEETKIGYINLCWDVEVLKEKCRNIWDDDISENVFIAGAQDLKHLKDKVKKWICGGGIDE